MLQLLPQDAEVRAVYDGAAGIEVDAVWLSREGSVLLADVGDVIYYEEDRPTGAPTENEDRYWTTAKMT